MSYDISIVGQDEKVVELENEHGQIGGTYQVERIPASQDFLTRLARRTASALRVHHTPNHNLLPDTKRAELNITYNYTHHYRKVWGFSLDKFHDMTVRHAKILLKQAIDILGTERDPNYWAPTAGNAGAAAQSLLLIINSCDDEDSIKVY